jgi:hypothetical protein
MTTMAEFRAAFGMDRIPFEGKIDIEYLLDIPNRSVAGQALRFMQVNEIELQKRHSPAEVERMWKGVLRACIAHGEPLTPNLAHYAKTLGIVLPG